MKIPKHEFICNLRFCDIIILFGTTYEVILCGTRATTVPFYNICTRCNSGGSKGGQFGATASPNVCGTPLNGRPFAIMRPILVAMEVETEIKNTLK